MIRALNIFRNAVLVASFIYGLKPVPFEPEGFPQPVRPLGPEGMPLSGHLGRELPSGAFGPPVRRLNEHTVHSAHTPPPRV